MPRVEGHDIRGSAGIGLRIGCCLSAGEEADAVRQGDAGGLRKRQDGRMGLRAGDVE